MLYSYPATSRLQAAISPMICSTKDGAMRTCLKMVWATRMGGVLACMGLVPQGKAAQILVLLEEVVGTLYMGAFVARLVAMYAGGRQ
jgi:hypothetical protein